MAQAEQMTSDEDVQATVKGSASKIRQAVEESALAGSGDPRHDEIYLNIGDNELRTIAGSDGNVVVSFCNFGEEHLEEIDGKCEAVIEVSEFLSYLEIATEGGMVELKFRGNDDERLSKQVTIDGKLRATVMLPGSTSVLEQVPLGLPKQYTDDNIQMNPDGDKLSTLIHTNTQELETIKDAVDLREDVDFYPVVVKDGDFRLDVGDNQSQSIAGALKATIDGPDVKNRYNEGFDDVVGTLSGEVRMATGDNAPVSIVQEKPNFCIRHTLGNVG